MTRPRSLRLVPCIPFLFAPVALAAQQAKRAEAPITVGANVQVSAAYGNRPHAEVIAAADPNQAGRLIACSMTNYEDQDIDAQHCYSSFDGGKTWAPSLVIDGVTVAADPAAVYGFGDTVFVESLTAPLKIPRSYDYDPPRLYRSLDGGKSFTQVSEHRDIDREYLAVDRSKSKFRGRLYINAQASVRGMRNERQAGVYLFHSADGGRTVRGPAVRANMEGGDIGGIGNMVVLSDGTVGILFGNTKKGRTQDLTVNDDHTANATMEFITSKDGGETLEASVVISPFFMDRPRSEGANLGQIAADASEGPFKDRIYAVWPDARDGRAEAWLAFSADKGKTWSAPMAVNDDRTFADSDRKRDHLLPAVAVNKDGVVAVSWYDRRDAADNLGWRVRMAVSFDGGETFSASVPVASAPNAYGGDIRWPLSTSTSTDSAHSLAKLQLGLDGFFESGGHTTGLVADANGVFHPVWVDNRTGVAQLWTAPVSVRGRATPNGSEELAGLADVTLKLASELSRTAYDRATNTVTATLRFKNVSNDTIRGPIKFRVVRLKSDLGSPEVVGSENAITGLGAVWDLSSMFPSGGLAPDSVSKPRVVTFKLSQVQPLKATRGFKGGVIALEGRILAGKR